MTRFSALDLASLPVPDILKPKDYNALLEARFAELYGRLEEDLGTESAMSFLATARSIAASPLRALSEAGAARELYVDNQILEAIRSVYLALAQGPSLDQLGAQRGVVRKVLDASDPLNPVLEKDGPFRARIQLAIEAWSPFGGEGAYVFWALQADDRIVDVAVYGPDSKLTPAIPPAEPKMIILSSVGDGAASEDLVQSVYESCTGDRRRPIGDKLTVSGAMIEAYSVRAVLHITSMQAEAAVKSAARASLETFLSERLSIGRRIFSTSIAAALKVAGVVEVELIEPATNLDIGPFSAGYCSSIELSAVPATGGWRDV